MNCKAYIEKCIDSFKFMIISCGVVFLTACATTSVSNTKYFLLDSTSKSSNATEMEPFTLGVGPVELASYLDQEGIASHTDDNQIEYSDDKRWAEPLDRNISQVLLSNLTILLPNQIIYPFPWKISQSPDYQMHIDIRRFGWFPNNRIALRAGVIIEDREDVIVFSGEQDIEFTAPESSYHSVVSTHNQLLERLSLRLVELLVKAISQEGA